MSQMRPDARGLTARRAAARRNGEVVRMTQPKDEIVALTLLSAATAVLASG